ncbi:MAG: ComEC/Rec2 family competence protein [Eisenbergiella sp.]
MGKRKVSTGSLRACTRKRELPISLAISGLHISLLGMGLYRLLTLRLSRKTASLLSSFVLISYLIMTGASLSAVRAVFMFFLYMLAGLAGRTYDMPTALSLAAVLLLVENPAYLSNSGFQLSFMAAGAAVVIRRPDGSERPVRGGIDIPRRPALLKVS